MLEDQLTAALEQRDYAQAEVDRLVGPAADATERLAEADAEARKLTRLADEAQAAANRSNEPADRQAAFTAGRAAERAHGALNAASAASERAHGALNAARSALSLAQVHLSTIDNRVHADDRAAEARRLAEAAEQAVTAASNRITALREQIEANTATLALHRAALDAAVVASDRAAWMLSQFDVQVGERAIADDTAELSQIDIKSLRTEAMELRSRADRLAQFAKVEAFSRSIDWNLMPGGTVTLRKHDRSVKIR